ncbi:MAG: DUF2500 domain-containing protein [Oscillospiraceae bacterium]|nr:DUF2500 domain-containing protein [Oscillospiraceae bacterium]
MKKERDKETRRSTALLHVFAAVFGCCILLVVSAVSEWKLPVIGSVERFLPHFVGVGIVALGGMIVGVAIWLRAFSVRRARVFVKSLERNLEHSTEITMGKVDFENEQGEIITVRVVRSNYDLFAEGDVGILHYETNKEQFFRDEAFFKKFEREGRSAIFARVRDKHCKTCGAPVQIDKFRAEIICQFCGDHLGGTSDESTAKPTKNNAAMKFGFFLGTLFFPVSIICVITWIVMLIRGAENTRTFLLGGVIAFAIALFGIVLNYKAMPTLKARALVNDRKGLDKGNGVISFELACGRLLVFDDVSESVYRTISKGDLGVLHYRFDASGICFFKKFEREGKFLTRTTVTDERCQTCGAHIQVDKFSSTTVCNYCGNEQERTERIL